MVEADRIPTCPRSRGVNNIRQSTDDPTFKELQLTEDPMLVAFLQTLEKSTLSTNLLQVIFQGFFPAPQDRKAALGKKCYWCGCTETVSWHRVPQDETFTKYECYNCYQVPSRRTFDPAEVAVREKRDLKRSWKMKDVCESCGETTGVMYNHPDLMVPMTICAREWSYYKKHGVCKCLPVKRQY